MQTETERRGSTARQADQGAVPVVDTSNSPHVRLRPVPLGAVTLSDTFWAPRRQTNASATLPSQFRHLEDTDRFYKITIVPDDGGEEVVYEKLSKRQRLRTVTVDDGDGRTEIHVAESEHQVFGVVDDPVHVVDRVEAVHPADELDIPGAPGGI